MNNVSVIIPALNEAESLPELFGEIKAVCQAAGLDYEIIVVDDGSRDGTFAAVRAAAAADPRVQGVRLRANCGKAAALSLGFSLARHEAVVTLDADLQDNPDEIPALLAKLEEGCDLVSGWKRTRHDPWHKVLPSRLFNFSVSRMAGLDLHDLNCGLKAYRTEVVRSLHLYGDLHRYIPVMAHWNGFRVAEMEVRHRPRKFGLSKYGWMRMPTGFLDLLTLWFLHRLGSRPAHLFGLAGLAAAGFGLAILLYFAGVWAWTGDLHMRPLLLGGVASCLVGIQFVSLGLLGELIVQRSSRGYPVASATAGLPTDLVK